MRQAVILGQRGSGSGAGHAKRGAAQKPQPRKTGESARIRLPQSGYFAEADPNAEVRSALGFVENPDIRKRPGRYQSDFIWNSDWESQMDQEAAEEAKRKRQAQAAPPVQSGGLGLSRMQELNRMDVDLSEQLKRRKIDVSSAAAALTKRPTGSAKPFQAESRRWERSGRFTKRAVISLETDSELQEVAESENANYEQLKQDLQLWTVAVTIFGISAGWLFYSQEVAVSYAVGAVGSLVYLRMLNRSIEGMTGGGLGGALGQPRLLIPIVLALGYNRWNQLKADETGIMLQLLPMLLGFFTYKAAVVSKQASTLLGELASSAASSNRAQNDA